MDGKRRAESTKFLSVAEGVIKLAKCLINKHSKRDRFLIPCGLN